MLTIAYQIQSRKGDQPVKKQKFKAEFISAKQGFAVIIQEEGYDRREDANEGNIAIYWYFFHENTKAEHAQKRTICVTGSLEYFADNAFIIQVMKKHDDEKDQEREA
ncbi:MAG: hypothetical protein BRD49_01950 [Bacteroidetes bacterium SW_10_40_5]|nr:MAG: hypothetical protein BRD49_01950 [Bacteroidetes bacterium SW_10_40_5]